MYEKNHTQICFRCLTNQTQIKLLYNSRFNFKPSKFYGSVPTKDIFRTFRIFHKNQTISEGWGVCISLIGKNPIPFSSELNGKLSLQSCLTFGFTRNGNTFPGPESLCQETRQSAAIFSIGSRETCASRHVNIFHFIVSKN